MANIVGANLASDSTTPLFGVGDVFEDYNGNVYVYVKATSAIAQYDAVTYDETFSTTVAPVSSSNDARGDKLGVAPVAIASGSYGWLQIYGPCTLTVLGSCAANVELATTATAGSLDDATTTGFIVAEGIFVTAANSASSAAAKAAILNFPQCGRTL